MGVRRKTLLNLNLRKQYDERRMTKKETPKYKVKLKSNYLIIWNGFLFMSFILGHWPEIIKTVSLTTYKKFTYKILNLKQFLWKENCELHLPSSSGIYKYLYNLLLSANIVIRKPLK